MTTTRKETQRQRIILATRNAGKLRELEALLADPRLELVGLDALPPMPEVEETGITFAENALLKARAACEATGHPAAADDSGLCVDALDGGPGVRSARFASEDASDTDNNARLLGELAGLPAERRGAHYACAAVLVLPGGDEVVVHGEVSGRIIEEPRGKGGFGYDPYFFYEPFGCTFAEAEPAAKNAVSHRGIAFRELAEEIRARLLARAGGEAGTSVRA